MMIKICLCVYTVIRSKYVVAGKRTNVYTIGLIRIGNWIKLILLGVNGLNPHPDVVSLNQFGKCINGAYIHVQTQRHKKTWT